MPRPMVGSTNLADAPTTPMRIIMGIMEAFGFVIVLLVCLVRGIEVSETLTTIIGTFILLQEGIDVYQWRQKRETDREYQRAKSGIAPAVEVTAEHATVTSSAPPPMLHRESEMGE